VAVRFRWTFGASSLTQVVSLAAGSPVLEFATTVDWHEDHRLLKVAFPVDVHAARATYEVQFGHVERATHSNTSYDHAQYEVCGHRWADLSEAGYGVALLNDCKYGYDIKGDVLRLSLLRASTMPDPEADRGEHRFRYALLPHAGTFQEAEVLPRAAELSVEPQARSTGTRPTGPSGAGERPSTQSLVSSSSPGVVASAVKRPDEGDGLVVRLFEAWGGRRRAQLRLAGSFGRAQLADLLERPRRELPLTDPSTLDLELGPFEIVTLLLTAPQDNPG